MPLILMKENVIWVVFVFVYKMLLTVCNAIYILMVLAGSLDLQFKILNALL